MLLQRLKGTFISASRNTLFYGNSTDSRRKKQPPSPFQDGMVPSKIPDSPSSSSLLTQDSLKILLVRAINQAVASDDQVFSGLGPLPDTVTWLQLGQCLGQFAARRNLKPAIDVYQPEHSIQSIQSVLMKTIEPFVKTQLTALNIFKRLEKLVTTNSQQRNVHILTVWQKAVFEPATLNIPVDTEFYKNQKTAFIKRTLEKHFNLGNIQSDNWVPVSRALLGEAYPGLRANAYGSLRQQNIPSTPLLAQIRETMSQTLRAVFKEQHQKLGFFQDSQDDTVEMNVKYFQESLEQSLVRQDSFFENMTYGEGGLSLEDSKVLAALDYHVLRD